MRPVSVIGVGSTGFGKLDGVGLIDLCAQACRDALSDAGIPGSRIGAFFLGNFASGILTGQEVTASLVANRLGLGHIPVAKMEGACASASLALRYGWLVVASGQCDFVLVAGAEKMSHCSTAKVTQALAAALDQEKEGKHGLSFPGFFALVAVRHMHEFGTTREQMALVSVKNRANGAKNPLAQFREPVGLDQVLVSRLIADPLRLFDCCPISDGAAAAVLCPKDLAVKMHPKPVDILAQSVAAGFASPSYMTGLTGFPATTAAARGAYSMAGLGPGDIHFAEVHDCFTISEIVDTEDLGFFEKEEGGRAVAEGWTLPGGRIPVNPSGGLLSKGHPVGATGLGQLYEAVLQIRGEHPNQLERARIGLVHNLGGTGAVASVTILGRGY